MTIKLKHLIVPSLLVLTLAACGPSETKNVNTDGAGANYAEDVKAEVSAAPELGSFGVDMASMKTSVRPGDNFFEYVNGTWLDETEIPADKSRFGSFDLLRDRSDNHVKKIIEAAAAKNAAVGTEEQKIGDFYGAFMDTDAIEAAGLGPIQADLERIRGAATHDDIAKFMADPGLGARSPLAGWVDVDFKDIENYIFYVTQSGLGMPNRNYYFDEGEKADQLRSDYVTFLTAMLTEAGVEDPAASAERVMALETRMAEYH